MATRKKCLSKQKISVEYTKWVTMASGYSYYFFHDQPNQGVLSWYLYNKIILVKISPQRTVK
jgi:hypothetical protein